MSDTFQILSILFLTVSLQAAEKYPDRFVWLFGWGFGSDRDLAEMNQVVESAGKSRLNGVVASLGFDTLCKHDAAYFRRLQEFRETCEKNQLELIPAVFSIGYGGGVLSHNRNLAEGLPVKNALFVAGAGEARFSPEQASRFKNGTFEDFNGNTARSFAFHDEPGKMSFPDREVKHGGECSLRMENFQAQPGGNGRVMQSIAVEPYRCYRVSFWVKTEGLQPAESFRAPVLAGDRDLAPREFHVPTTTDWRQISFLFNSLTHSKVNLYAGIWRGRAGKFWLDDWVVEEVGPVNVLCRPGTPTTVQNEAGSIAYESGKDFVPLRDPQLQPYSDTKEAMMLKLPAGSRIREGDRLRVGWYHSLLIHDSQVVCCMAEPEVQEIMDHEAKLLVEKLKPSRVLLNMDEVRMGGTCKACSGKDMARLLGECVTKQAETLRKYSPTMRVYAWSDMLDPHHNAKPDYYLVNGDYTGSWKHVPKDLVIAVWGGAPRPDSLNFFAGEGFQTLVACYYDGHDLDEVKGWMELAGKTRGVRGFMYTPWTKKYSLLPEFGALLRR